MNPISSSRNRSNFWRIRRILLASSLGFLALGFTETGTLGAQRETGEARDMSGEVLTAKDEAVRGVTVIVRGAEVERRTTTDEDGRFSLRVPPGALRVRLEGPHLRPAERELRADERVEGLRFVVEFVLPRVHESLVIMASPLEPGVELQSDAMYRKTLFSRDDQILEIISAGINAGQHEGGGKSLEIRRFGFNLDHGGVSGGLKVLVDNVQQNHATQGHGQGYLGQLKTLTPELVEEVQIINGPFSAEYGDFSGLGVVHVRLRESLTDELIVRAQGGSFGASRLFAGWSPGLAHGDAFLAFERSSTDGPFLNPLGYRRDNLTGNYTRRLRDDAALSFKMNLGRNDFTSSGQIPLDEVAAGRLDRFGFVDPTNGGSSQSGTLGVYYRKPFASGDTFKMDGFVSRSLLDLYSNFTFYLEDPEHGDAFQQHDSRYQQGFNTQYLRLNSVFGARGLLALGTNFHHNQIHVGLFPQIARNPTGVTTRGRAGVTNFAGYAQQGLDLARSRVHVEAGVRWDGFRFRVDDEIFPEFSGAQRAARWQPKAALAYTPSWRVPLRLHVNYGRGISSQDARGVVQRPESPRLAATDFFQFGTSHRWRRVSLVSDLFLIDRSNEQVYVPDDGSVEFFGPSRAYGYEAKTAVELTRRLMLHAGWTQVMNAFFRGASPRRYVASAPHCVVNGALTLNGWRGFFASLRYRHIGNYRLDEEDATVRAAGFDVVDLSVTRALTRRLDFSVAADNLTNKVYYETQNSFVSRLRPDAPAVARIHATPGFPFGVTLGLTFHLRSK